MKMKMKDENDDNVVFGFFACFLSPLRRMQAPPSAASRLSEGNPFETTANANLPEGTICFTP